MSYIPPQTISPLTNALTAGTNINYDKPIMLAKKFMFGTKPETPGGVHFLDESTIVWVACKSVVVYNTTQLQQQLFLPSSDTCEWISCMATSANRRCLAVAEASNVPLINLYNFNSSKIPEFSLKRTLQMPDLGSKEFVSMCFSADGRYLAALGGFPKWNLVLWNVEKGKVLATVFVEDSTDSKLLNQVSISPKDNSLICVSGNGIFRFYRFSDGNLRQLPMVIPGDPVNYLAHLWLPPDDRVIVSTDNGDLLLIENCEYKHPLLLSPSNGLSINTLVAYTNGFVCGGEMGLVTIFEKSEDKEIYRILRSLKVETENRDADGYLLGEESAKVLSFSLTPPPGEENVAILTSKKQLVVLNLSNADFTRPDDRVCDDICQPFHAGPVTGLDICVRKPLIATCGKDRNIILWNYQTKSVECSKHFSAEILSVSIHPSGLHLIAGFPDKLRFMNIYGDDIREFHSYNIRSCTECRFSNGGQFFAAATPAHTIHVYGTYTCELIGHLKGHIGKVKSLLFVPPDDTRILSVGSDGVLMEFDLTVFHKVQDNAIKVISYNAVSGDATTVWTAGNDRKLRQFERNHLQQLSEFDTRNTSIMCMSQSLNLRLLYTGCEDGTLRVFNTYLAEKTAGERKKEEKNGSGQIGFSKGNRSLLSAQLDKMDIMVESHMAHLGPISRIAVSFDEELVVTAGEDGVIIIWNVTAPHKGTKKEFKFTEEILIEKRDLDERTRNIANLQNILQELQQKKHNQSSKRRRKHEDMIHKLEEDHQEEKMRQNAQFFKLDAEFAEQKLKFTEDLRALDQKNVHDTNHIDQEYNSKIQAFKEQSQKLRHTIEEQIRDFNQEARDREKKWQDTLESESRRQEAEYAAINSKIVRIIAEESKMKEEADEVHALIEEDTESEIIALQEAFEKQRINEETFISKLQSENATLLNNENNVKHDLNAKKLEIAEKLKQQASLDVQVEALSRDIDALNNELKERADTISEKDKRIFDLKSKNQELEKIKFVLEYKIKELKTQIDPRDEEIRHAQTKYADMEEECNSYISSNEALVLQLRSLKQKLNVHTKEIESLRPQLQNVIEYQSRLWTEISDLYEEKEPKRLKEITKALYVRYANDDKASNGINAPSSAARLKATQVLSSRTPEDAQQEYTRQRDYLEGTLDGLKRKLVDDSEGAKTERARIIKENVTLVRQINELRREVKALSASKRQVSLSGGDEDYQRELQIQRAEIHRLRARADELERQVHAATRVVSVPVI